MAGTLQYGAKLSPADPCPELADIAAGALPDRSIDTDPPTVDEVRRSIEKLKNGRAAGGDGITPELLKCAPVPIANALHALFCKVWETGRVSVSWRDGIIVPLYKGKGSTAECSNYRPISLLSVPGKVFAHVLLNRLNPLLVQSRRPEQSGFTAGRSTADAILALRLLAELHLEFKRPLHVAYVDLKSAFDSVDRAALWSALKGIGTPDILLRLLQDLHANTGAQVRVGATVSDRFSTTSGVRQGCVLAPALFCRAIDWILEHTDGLKGVSVGAQTFTDLDYADDIALPGSHPDDLTTCLRGFSSASRTMGLNVSWPKTKVQSFGTDIQASNVSVDGQHVELVDQFCYLGSIIDASGRCRPDLSRRLGLASSAMNSLSRVWTQGRLSLVTKLRIYQTCVVPVLLYGSDTWVLLSTDTSRLQAFHMRCQRRVLGVKWQDKVTNVAVSEQTCLPPITELINKRRSSLFGHVVRLSERTPAHRALRLAVDVRSNGPPSPSWRRPRGRPRDTWIKPLLRSDIPINALWDSALARGHGALAQRLPPDK